MPILICGSLAYDTIMVFPDHFKRHILPEQVHILNVSFLVPELRKEFGGCAGNIGFNLKLLGGEPWILATAGQDFSPYDEWLSRHDIDTRHIHLLQGHYTAQAFITTDLDDNQITAFHPGAMSMAHQIGIGDIDLSQVSWGIVSPNSREAMLRHAAEFAQADIPFIFDPGQGLPMFDGPTLLDFFDKASVVTVNDYESKLIEQRTGLSVQKLAQRVSVFVITRSDQGSLVWHGGKTMEIPAAKTQRIIDPTGCGDAYRAGLLFGLDRGMDLETTARIASLMGAIKVEHPGTQNHAFGWHDFTTRFADSFGYSL